MRSYHFTLTRDLDSTVINGLLANEGRGLQMQSDPQNADNAGRKGRIIIPSLHHGSGQTLLFDPARYAGATPSSTKGGWDTTEPGHIKSVQLPQTAVTVDASAATTSQNQRGALFFAQGRKFLITADKIYESTAGGTGWTTALTHTAPAGTRFTGGYAVWGDYIFFGREVTATRAAIAATYRTPTPAYFNASTFNAAYFAVVGSRLFGVDNGGTPGQAVNVQWTDQRGTGVPVLSTVYSYPTDLRAMDAAKLGSSFVVGLGGVTDHTGEVITLDIEGTFTNIVPLGNWSQGVSRLVPFHDGILALVTGQIGDSLYFADIDAFTRIHVNAIEESEFLINSYAGIAAHGSRAYIGGYTDKGIWRTLTVTIDPEDNRLYCHNGVVYMREGTIAAHYHINTSGQAWVQTAYYDPAPADDIMYQELPIWHGRVGHAGLIDATTEWLYTSEYPGDSYGLKQLLSVSGRVQPHISGLDPLANETLQFRVWVMGASGTPTAYVLPSLAVPFPKTIGGWFYIEPDEQIIGREFQLNIKWDDPDGFGSQVDILCPLVMDYVELPNQTSIATLTCEAGSLQVHRMGGITKQSRRQILTTLEDAVANPSVWTLAWGDGAPNWKVVIVGYSSQEVEDAVRGGEGLSVVSIVVKRLNDTARALTV